MGLPQYALDDYFDERLDSLTRRVDRLLAQMDRWSEDQAMFLHRLDLLENCDCPNLEERRGY